MTTPSRTAVYLRISEDRSGQGLNVESQREACVALAEQLGWAVAAVLTDNDVSAYSGKPRPAYRALLDGLDDGTYDAVIAWHNDRLHRQPSELEEFIAVIGATRAQVAMVQGGAYDLTSASGRMHARIVGAVARGESEHKGERLRLKHQQLAHAGRNGGGGTRPYGYADDRVTVVEDEAALIREACERVLRGDAVGRICRDWTARGLTTVTGTTWKTTVLRRVLVAPRTAGLRELNGDVVGAAQWEAILTRAEHEQVRAVLLDPGRRKGGRPRAYLLTGGLAVCGLCGGRLSARPKADGRRCYVCARSPEVGLEGCGKIRVLAERLEDDVRDRVIAALRDGWRDTLAAVEEDGRHGELLTRLRKDEDALARLDADLDDGLMDRGRWLARNQRIRARMADTREALGRVSRSGVLHSLPEGPEALRGEWEQGDAAWRRAVVSAVVEAVTVGPAVRGRNFYDPARVAITWRA